MPLNVVVIVGFALLGLLSLMTAFGTASVALPPPPEATALVTKAVVAICVVFVPAAAVGAVGVPVSAGEAEKTTEPDPVSSVKADARFALDGVARKVATPVPK